MRKPLPRYDEHGYQHERLQNVHCWKRNRGKKKGREEAQEAHMYKDAAHSDGGTNACGNVGIPRAIATRPRRSGRREC